VEIIGGQESGELNHETLETHERRRNGNRASEVIGILGSHWHALRTHGHSGQAEPVGAT
jgi:hypothetical protein